jgi:peptide/nickel transport system substrate-binding protein
MILRNFCTALVPALLLFTSCGGPADKKADGWSTENVVVYHWKAEPDDLHPTNGATDPRRVIMEHTQRFIINADYEKLDIRPDLVKSLPEISEDGLRYTYELRDEPAWDDGAQLSVEDVMFTLMAWKCPYTDNAYARPYLEYLKGIEKDPSNPRKFILVMRAKYIQNITFLGDIPIMERKYHDPQNVMAAYKMEQFDDSSFVKEPHKDLQDWAKNFNDPKYGRDINFLNGLGAYKVAAWEEKQRIEIVKKKDHWTSKVKNPDMYDVAYPEKIIFKINLDDNSIALELKKQVIDASSWISTHGLVELQQDSNFNRNYYSEFVPNYTYQYIGLNMKPESVNRKPFFTDKRVRRAMALLTPVEEINQANLDGKATRMTSCTSPIKTNVYDNTLTPLPYDLEGAKKLLDEAGWKDTDGDNIRDKMIDGKKVQFEVEFLITQGKVVENIAKAVADGMYPAGIKVNIRALEFVTHKNTLTNHDFDMYMASWSGAFVPDDYKQLWHSEMWANGGSNYVGFGNRKSDALIDSIRITLNDAERIPMEKRLQRIIYDEQPYIFMFQIPRKVAIHRRFENAKTYREKPGLYLSNLRVGAGTMVKVSDGI